MLAVFFCPEQETQRKNGKISKLLSGLFIANFLFLLYNNKIGQLYTCGMSYAV